MINTLGLTMTISKHSTKLKNALFLIMLTFTIATFANEKDLSFPFSKDSGNYWQYVSDRTMGGVSNGQVTLEQDEGTYFARLSGNVSTKNNGGFIQLRSGISFADTEKNGKALRGVRLKARGNGERYYIFIRTNENWSYSDYYSASFEASQDWQVIDLPFNTFERKQSPSSTLYAKNITRFAVVAYGRDFAADVSVADIAFYY